jgi:hypothetical protein
MAQLLLHLGSNPPAPGAEKTPRLSTSTSKLSISFLVDDPPADEDSSSSKRKRRHTDALGESRVKVEPGVEHPQPPRPAKRARARPQSNWSGAAASSSSARSIIHPPVALPTSLAPTPTPLPAPAAHHPATYQASSLFPPTPYFVVANPQLLSAIHQQLLLAQTAQAYLLHQASHQHHQQQQQHQPPQRPSPLYPQTAPVYLGPSTPPGLSSASSPPSSPALLSSSPSSPLHAGAASTSSRTYSGESPSRGYALGDRNSAPNPPVGGNNLHGDNIDVQQHTQQLLKQWHRQRQVQKMLYLQQKKHKKQQQQQRPHVLAPVRATTATTATMIPPVPTFTSAAVGQPSSLSAETLMALIDELLRRHVGSDAPRPCAGSPQDKKEKAQPAGSKRRHRVPPEHLQVLEEVFAAEPFPHAEAKNELALRLGMTKRSITIWFQNKRARLKRNDEEMSPSSSSASARSPAKSDTGIVFHQLTVDTSGQLAIIPEFPLQV